MHRSSDYEKRCSSFVVSKKVAKPKQQIFIQLNFKKHKNKLLCPSGAQKILQSALMVYNPSDSAELLSCYLSINSYFISQLVTFSATPPHSSRQLPCIFKKLSLPQI